jgi:apolipoprotein N-acyltransferase
MPQLITNICIAGIVGGLIVIKPPSILFGLIVICVVMATMSGAWDMRDDALGVCVGFMFGVALAAPLFYWIGTLA